MINCSEILIISGLLLDILGSYFILNIFFSLSENKGKSLSAEDVVEIPKNVGQIEKIIRDLNDGTQIVVNGEVKSDLIEDLEQNKTSRENSLIRFYEKMGKDAKIGFFLLALGFILQIVGNII